MPIVLEQIRLLFWDLLVTCVIFGAHSYESDTSLVLGTTSSCQSLNTCQWSLSLGFNGIVEWISHQSHFSERSRKGLETQRPHHQEAGIDQAGWGEKKPQTDEIIKDGLVVNEHCKMKNFASQDTGVSIEIQSQPEVYVAEGAVRQGQQNLFKS